MGGSTSRSDSAAESRGEWRSDKLAFKVWVKAAVEKPVSQQRQELYDFLTECFQDADGDRDGLVNGAEFDFLIEKAAALPRRFGLAPSWNEAYGSVEQRQKARLAMFLKMNVSGSNAIGMEEWISYSITHITEKVRKMDMETMDWARLEASGVDAFMMFLRTATTDNKSKEYKELYTFLFNNFTAADTKRKGSVTVQQFDILVEMSAAAPRQLGLAPKSSEMFKSDTERLAARRKLFDGMNTSGTGVLTFDEYLKYTVQHIGEKVRVRDAGRPAMAGSCPWQVDKAAFKGWVKTAMEVRDSAERKELYTFLAECFQDADSDRDGLVNGAEFDFLIEKSAALPRRFGLAPSWTEAYGTVDQRQKARLAMFKKMNVSGSNAIGMGEWMDYSFKHIAEKVKGMESHTMDFTKLEAQGAAAFVKFLDVATKDNTSKEYKELYSFLFNNFVKADSNQVGAVTLEQFDLLVEMSAAAPRSLGLAPKNSEMFKDGNERLEARRKLFNSMNSSSTGVLTFDEYLKYTTTHIAAKVATAKTGGKCPM